MEDVVKSWHAWAWLDDHWQLIATGASPHACHAASIPAGDALGVPDTLCCLTSGPCPPVGEPPCLRYPERLLKRLHAAQG